MIDDGYGDLKPWEQTEEALVGDWEGWIKRAAIRICEPSDFRFDDAVQEGRIEFWRAAAEFRDHPQRVRFSLNRAKQRMWHVLHRGRPMTGNLHKGLRYEPNQPLRLDKPVGWDDTDRTFGDLIEAPGSLDGIEMAYHHGQIAQAINALPEQHREYVVRRFWLGYTDSEIARQFGLSPNGINNRWTRTIRPALVERLDHLAGVA